MKVYPLIYSRTKLCDYVSGFLVRPNDLDYTAASKYVSVALNEIKYSDGLRHAVFSVGEYIIYGGTACITSELISRFLKDKKIDQLDFKFKEFQFDQAGRPITFFVGFAVKRENVRNLNQIPNIDLYKTYLIYLKYLEKQWYSITTQTEELNADDGIELQTVEYLSKYDPKTIKKNGISILKNYDENLYQDIINYYFRQLVINPAVDNSFLSCVLPEMITDSLIFKNISIFGITVEEYLRRSDHDKAGNIVSQLLNHDESPRIFQSAEEFIGETSRNTKVREYKNNTDRPRIYHNVNEYVRDRGNYAGKKIIPTSKMILVIIAIVLLVVIILVVADQTNAKNKSLSQLQSMDKDQRMPQTKSMSNVELEDFRTIIENIR